MENMPEADSRVLHAEILIIDDEAGIRDLLTQELKSVGYSTDASGDGEAALAKMQAKKFQVILCDLNMPKMNGLETLEEIRKIDPDAEVIMMTGYATIETAVEAMKKGAYDFVQKPFNLSEVLMLVEKCVEKSDLRSVVEQLRIANKKLAETQMQLIQSEKLAGIGQLAAGVAHELNNPLSGVVGFSQLMLTDKTLTPQQRSDAQMIYSQSQRCKTIIQNLLHFCRRQDSVQEPVQLVDLLRATVQLVMYEFATSGLHLVLELPPTLPPVMGNGSQLQQIFLNLITNSRQAMDGQRGGRLLVRSELSGDWVRLFFTDNGPGIPADIQGKIFDPFFTTKPVGQGTGLGLSISYGIARNHHGDLRVQSQSGEGATFIVELPAWKSDEVHPAP